MNKIIFSEPVSKKYNKIIKYSSQMIRLAGLRPTPPPGTPMHPRTSVFLPPAT